MRADLLQPLEVLPQFIVQPVGQNLAVFAILDVLLSVEEPIGDFILPGVLHNGDDALHLVLRQLPRPLRQVDVGLTQHHMGVAPPHALDGGDGEGDLAAPINVGVQHSQNVLEQEWRPRPML